MLPAKLAFSNLHPWSLMFYVLPGQHPTELDCICILRAVCAEENMALLWFLIVCIFCLSIIAFNTGFWQYLAPILLKGSDLMFKHLIQSPHLNGGCWEFWLGQLPYQSLFYCVFVLYSLQTPWCHFLSEDPGHRKQLLLLCDSFGWAWTNGCKLEWPIFKKKKY